MPDGNSLVAQAPGDPDGVGPFTEGNGDYGWAGGIGIAESAFDTFNGIKDGNWVEAGLGMVGLAAEGMNAAIDPFGWLMSSVASFLMEHIQPLKDMLDSVAGDPPVIQSYAETWGNVSSHLTTTEENYTKSVKAAKSSWEGGAAEAYQRHADEMTDALKAAASVAGSVSTVTMVFGEVVAFVRELVRDLIADLVGKLIAWVLETVFSLGFGTPVVVAQATAAIAKWATKIADLLRRLTDTIRRVSPLLGKLADVLGKITKVFAKVAGKVMGFNPRSDITPGFIQRPGRGGSPDGGTPNTGNGPDGDSGDGGSGSGDGSGDSGSGNDSDSGAGSDGNGSDGNGSNSGNGSDGNGSNSGDGTGNSSGNPSSTSGNPGNTSPGGTSTSPDGPGAGPTTRTPSGNSPSTSPDGGSPSGTSPDGGSPSPSTGGNPSPGTHSPSTPNTAYNSPNGPGTHAPDSTPSGYSPSPSPAPATPSSPSPHAPDGGSPGSPGPHGGSPAPHSPDGGSPGGPSGGAPSSPASPGSPGPQGGSPAPHSPDGGSPGAPSSPASPTSGGSPGTHTPTSHSPSPDTPNRPDGATTPGSTTPGSTATPAAPAAAVPHMPTPRTDSPNSPQSPSGTPIGGMPASPGGGPGGSPGGGSPGGGPTPGGRPPSGWTGTPGTPAPHSPAPSPHNRPGGPNQQVPVPHSPAQPRPGGPAPHTSGPHGPGPHSPGPHGPTPHGAVPQPMPRGYDPGFGPNRPGPGSPGSPGSPNGPGGPGRPPHAGGPNQHGPDGHHTHDPRSADPTRPDHDPNKPDRDPNQPDSTPDRDPLPPDQVNGSHADQTPAGTSYHRGDPEMGDLPHRVQPDPDGRYTVDVHVTPDGHARIGGRDYTPEQFADILRRNGDYDGRPIRLIGCDAGSNDFAQRLSRELDTPVLAPDRPAWTDSNGRVFSSDYEIGPDGRVQPRIPPNGEWSVHNPDGTTHRASDDGFTPDTKNADKHDIDTASARDRGHPPIDTNNPTAIESRPEKPSMTDKINDPEYRRKYYEESGRRRHERQTDSNGDRVPKIAYDKTTGQWYTKPEDPKLGDYEPATPSNTVEHKATPEQKAAAQKLVDERHAAKEKWDKTNEKYWKAKDDAAPHVRDARDNSIQAAKDKHDKAVAEADAEYQKNKDTDPKAKEKHDQAVRDAAADRKKEIADAKKAYTDAMRDVKIDEALEKDMKQAHRDRTDTGERLGEHSASESVRTDYPDPPNKVENVTPKTGDKQGSGRFDQVYKVETPDGETKYVIAEAKGPEAGTGTREGLDGKRYEQGHPKYVESVIANMENSKFREERQLAAKLRLAQDDGTLEYRKVTAMVDEPPKPKPTKGGDSTDGPPPQKKQKVEKPEYAGHERADYDVRLP